MNLNKLTKKELIDLVMSDAPSTHRPGDVIVTTTRPPVTENTAKITLRAQLRAAGKSEVADNLDLSESALRAHLNTVLAQSGLRVVSDSEVARPEKAPARNVARKNRHQTRAASKNRPDNTRSTDQWEKPSGPAKEGMPAGVHNYYIEGEWTWFRPMKRPSREEMRQIEKSGFAWSLRRKAYYCNRQLTLKRCLSIFNL